MLVLFCLALTTTSFGQKATTTTTKSPTASDYERIIAANYEVEFRKLAIETLDLTEKETEAFTPIYLAYMNEKSELMERRQKLVDEYKDEMAEDDTAEDEAEETADFIENYWEVDIAEMELRKDYFDKLEDKIPYDKAVTFFLLEEAVESDMQSMAVVNVIPTAIQVRRPYVAYRNQTDAYNTWMININGSVELDHAYTRNGLYKLVDAAAAIATSQNVTVTDMDMKAKEIKQLADGLQDNWRSTDHADKARKAFTMTADLMKSIQQKGNFTTLSTSVSDLEKAAKKIDPSVLMTEQADHIYNFFEQAQKVVNAMAKEAQMSSARG